MCAHGWVCGVHVAGFVCCLQNVNLEEAGGLQPDQQVSVQYWRATAGAACCGAMWLHDKEL